MKIKGAIFDMDGTLVDSLSFWGTYWKAFGKQYFGTDHFTVAQELDRKVRTTIFVQAVRLAWEYYHLDVSYEELMEFSRRGIDEFYRNEVRPKDGVFAFLDHLKAQGVKLCVASATEMGHVRMALSHHGLEPYFDQILSCADIGKNKDEPDIYYLAAERLGLAPHELCVFEDSYVALETAKNAGFCTVGIYDSHNYSQDRLEAASQIYLANGQSWDTLIPLVGKEK